MANLIQSVSASVGNATTVAVQLSNSAGNGTVNTTAGSFLIAYVGSLTSGRTCSASDNVNGSYNTDSTAASSASICSIINTVGGALTVTGTISGGATNIYMLVQEWNLGLLSVSPLDIHINGGNWTAVTNFTTTATGVLAQANEIVVGMFQSATTLGSPVLATGAFTEDNASPVTQAANVGMGVCYQIVSSTASVAPSMSWQNSTNGRTAVATYKVSSATLSVDTLLGQGWV